MSQQEATTQPDPAQLAEMIKGLSDEELAESLKNLGIDEVLSQIFAGMQGAFDPAKAAGVDSTIVYEIETPDGTKTWSVKVADGKCEVTEGAADSPRLTLTLQLVDFIRLIFNQADGPQLFMSGKMKLKGDMMFAMQMQGFFKREF
jgi:putative sterol carrier protein